MPVKLKITKLPQLNSIVIKQEGGHFFIATSNSFIIDKEGLLKLLGALIDIEFVDLADISSIIEQKEFENNAN